jgi:uncharacterized flavoprotein (TIGR03862 family)
MSKTVAIIGGGPAGLMAAEILSAQGFDVTVYERKPSVGRKFLMAGRGGLNITHSETLDNFVQKYGAASDILSRIIHEFTPQDLKNWCEGLGEKTFVGSSGRVFPESFKASPLLRAWIKRLENQGVKFAQNYDWRGWNGQFLRFKTPDGPIITKADATFLALGGASWPRLGSDGSWVDILQKRDVEIAPLEPSNCGFVVPWSDIFRQKFAGQPLKPVVASYKNSALKGEIMITANGVEGGLIYTHSAAMRDDLHKNETVTLYLDLKPDITQDDLEERLKKPRGRESFSNVLRKSLNLSGVATGVLMESPDRKSLGDYPPAKLAALIKSYPLIIHAPFSIDRAISSAGGIKFESLDENFMLKNIPGVFVAGEMLDWEAPTGGYLLQGTLSSAVYTARRMAGWLNQKQDYAARAE